MVSVFLETAEIQEPMIAVFCWVYVVMFLYLTAWFRHSSVGQRAELMRSSELVASRAIQFGSQQEPRMKILGVSEQRRPRLHFEPGWLWGPSFYRVQCNYDTISPECLGQKFVSLKVGYSHPIELGLKGVGTHLLAFFLRVPTRKSSVRCRDQRMEETRTIQGKGDLCQW